MKAKLQDIAFVVGLGAGIVAWAQLVERPALRRADSVRFELTSTKDAIGWGNDFTKDLDELERLLDQFETDLVALDQLVPRQVDPSQRVGEIASVANAVGIDAKSIRPDGAQPRGAITVYPVTVILSGRYAELLQFLHAAEALPRLTRVTRLEVREDELRKGRVTAEVELSSYSINDGAGA